MSVETGDVDVSVDVAFNADETIGFHEFRRSLFRLVFRIKNMANFNAIETFQPPRIPAIYVVLIKRLVTLSR